MIILSILVDSCALCTHIFYDCCTDIRSVLCCMNYKYDSGPHFQETWHYQELWEILFSRGTTRRKLKNRLSQVSCFIGTSDNTASLRVGKIIQDHSGMYVRSKIRSLIYCIMSPTRFNHTQYKGCLKPSIYSRFPACPDVRVEDITSDHEFLLLACDGIWDVLTNQEVVEFVRARIAQRMQPEIVSISHWRLNVVHTLCHLKYAHVEFNYLCHFSVDKWENM